MGLRFDPMGGGQFKNAVKTIIEAERQPIKNIEGRKTREEARMKLFQEFKTKFTQIERGLDDFANFRKFRELKADLGGGDQHISVTVDKDKAEPGRYSVEVSSLAHRSSVISNAFEDPEESQFGIGFVVFELPGGDTKEIFVDSRNASLRKVADLINNTKDSPVQASVIRDASGESKWRLIMTAKKDGAENGLGFPELYFLDGDRDFFFENKNDAENAVIKIDGFEIESDSNDIKDFVKGVNLHLKQAAPEKPFEINITQDYQKIAGKVKNMVEQINGVLEFINKQNQLDDKSDTKSTFAGDTGMQTIEYRLRNMLHEGFPVGDWEDEPDKFMHLSELGIEFTKTGSLTFKEEKFTKVMENNFDYVSEAISGEFGFATQLRNILGGYTRSNTGLLALREQGIKQRIKQYDDTIGSKEARLAQREQRLVEQFSRLQGSLNDLQRQQAALGSIGGGGGGSLLNQLLGSG